VVASVLVIDNDVALTEIFKAILEPAQFDVFTAHEVEEGLEAVNKIEPDVIVLDLYMPEVNGWQICRDIRALTDVPILILSALYNPEAVAQALDEGADDYLSKPVPSGVLIAHLKTLIRRSNKLRAASNIRED
jgi:DNA-binding response OmpR family regulator